MNTLTIDSTLQTLAALPAQPGTLVLCALLVAAAAIDHRTRRIPNWLTAGGMLAGLALNALLPAAPQVGLPMALGGLALGFAVMLPPYAMRVMGAGDVKLMAMVGAFLGLRHTAGALVFVFVTGGVAALGVALSHRALGRLLGNARNALQGMAWAALSGHRPAAAGVGAGTSVGRLPYGTSIGVGTIAYLVARQLGYV